MGSTNDNTVRPTGSEQSAAMRRADTANGEGPADVAVAPRLLRVLLAVDDSDTSLRAARTAHRMFGDEAKYFVINVGSREVPMWGGGLMAWGVPYPLDAAWAGGQTSPLRSTDASEADVWPDVDRAQAEAQTVSTAAELPPDFVALGATGDPVVQIHQVADEQSIDVVVVGAGSGGWWRHLLDPSVSKAIVRNADRPVLVVP